MHLRLIDYVMWIVQPLLQAGVLLCMFRRGLHRDYPYFFNYTILQVISGPILLAINYYSYAVYYYAYYVNLGLSVVISFFVLQEILKDAFRPYEALRDLSVILFRWSALVVLLVGVMWAINSAGKADNEPVTEAILLADRSVRLMQCGLLDTMDRTVERLLYPPEDAKMKISARHGSLVAELHLRRRDDGDFFCPHFGRTLYTGVLVFRGGLKKGKSRTEAATLCRTASTVISTCTFSPGCA
jgi:hypothetical protein